jgi:PAS domain S-box-containing protein
MPEPKPQPPAWQDELFRLLIETSRDYAVFVVDLEGRVLTWNAGAERVLGYAEGEIVGQSSFLFFTPEDRAAGVPQRELQTALREGRAGDDPWHVRKGGSRFWASGVMSLLRQEGGRPRALAKVMRDYTEAKLTGDALRESEGRLRVALSAAEMGTWLWRIPQDEQVLDDSLRRLMGLQLGEEVMDLGGFLRAIHAGDRDRVRDEFERCRREDGDFHIEFRVTWPDGSVHWLRDQGKTFLDRQGHPLFLTGACVDITERKRVEEDRAKLAAIVESSGDAIVSKALDGTILSWNAGAERLFGYAASEAIGQPITLIIPPERLDEEREILARLWRGERIEHFETVRVAKDGRRLDISLTLSPVHNTRGEVVGASKVARDISRRKRAEEALREADRQKDEFISLLAHELRNPLAPIRNGLQVMRLAASDAAAVSQARAMMDRQLTHLVRLVDDLLDISRISRNKMELRKERVLLADAVASAVETARPAIEAGGHELTVSLPPEPIFLDADLTRLAQVFSNLLTNSAKYTPRGGNVWLTAWRPDGEVFVSVRDSGLGIPAEALPHVFDMFSQVDRSVERSTGGLGIGLALVKGLVEMHGGTVTAESEGPGKGSTFTVRFPLPGERARAEPWGKAIRIIALTGWGQEGDKERSAEAECDGHLIKPVNLPDLEKALAEERA